MTIKMSVFGVKEARSFLKSKNIQTSKNIAIGINKAAFFLQGEVKSSIAGHRNEPTSVDTGRFLNSVDVSTSKDNASVFTKVPYAKHLEFGTSRIGARKHFANSKDRNKQKVKNIILKELK